MKPSKVGKRPLKGVPLTQCFTTVSLPHGAAATAPIAVAMMTGGTRMQGRRL